MAAVAKKANAFVSRANELDATHPIVSYYCRLQAAEMLMKAHQEGTLGPAELQLLQDILGKAEAGKQALNADKNQDKDYVENYAHNWFNQCDAIDRRGMADKTTAAKYYVAITFFEACAQFYGGELPPDLVEKKKYSAYRATEIMRCLKAGTAITPPPDAPALESAPTGVLPSVATAAPEPTSLPAPAPTPEPAPKPQFVPFVPPAAATQPSPTPQPAPAPISIPPVVAGSAAPAQVKADAKKKAEFAASALEFNDTAGAQKFLQEALQLLGPYES